MMTQTLALKFKEFTELDKKSGFLDFAQTLMGKIFLVLTFALILYSYHIFLPTNALSRIGVVIAMIALTTAFPHYRRPILAIFCLIGLPALIQWKLLQPLYLSSPTAFSATALSATILHSMIIASVFIFMLAYNYFVKYFINAKWMRPIFFLISINCLLLIIVSYIPMSAFKIYLWSFLFVLNIYFWYACYTLADKKDGRYFSSLNLLPFWGGTTLPYAKGWSYLRNIEAKNSEELAISQIKGIKLLIWAFIINVALQMDIHLSHYFNIPTMGQALQQIQAGHPLSTPMAWICMINSQFNKLLLLCVIGHFVIAIYRMAGYRALRATYKPLYAKSIADFWNRYSFYFKELLVEFFFYPTFFRYFKNKPRLRLFFATFMAACFGNFLYHFFTNPQYLISLGFFAALKNMSMYGIYALILSVGIFISQIRNAKARPKTFLQRYITTPITVIGFFCLLNVISTPYTPIHIHTAFAFYQSLL